MMERKFSHIGENFEYIHIIGAFYRTPKNAYYSDSFLEMFICIAQNLETSYENVDIFILIILLSLRLFLRTLLSLQRGSLYSKGIGLIASLFYE